jgi:hypothetical protein
MTGAAAQSLVRFGGAVAWRCGVIAGPEELDAVQAAAAAPPASSPSELPTSSQESPCQAAVWQQVCGCLCRSV